MQKAIKPQKQGIAGLGTIDLYAIFATVWQDKCQLTKSNIQPWQEKELLQ